MNQALRGWKIEQFRPFIMIIPKTLKGKRLPLCNIRWGENEKKYSNDCNEDEFNLDKSWILKFYGLKSFRNLRHTRFFNYHNDVKFMIKIRREASDFLKCWAPFSKLDIGGVGFNNIIFIIIIILFILLEVSDKKRRENQQ